MVIPSDGGALQTEHSQHHPPSLLSKSVTQMKVDVYKSAFKILLIHARCLTKNLSNRIIT